MSKIISLFEQRRYSYQELNLKPDDPFLDALEKLNNSDKERRGFIQLERNSLNTTQYVGVVQNDDWVIQILPKIDDDPKGDSKAEIATTLTSGQPVRLQETLFVC